MLVRGVLVRAVLIRGVLVRGVLVRAALRDVRLVLDLLVAEVEDHDVVLRGEVADLRTLLGGEGREQRLRLVRTASSLEHTGAGLDDADLQRTLALGDGDACEHGLCSLDLAEVQTGTAHHDGKLHLLVLVERLSLGGRRQGDGPLGTTEAPLAVRHDGEVLGGTVQATDRPELTESLGEALGPVGRETSGLTHDVHATRTTHSLLGVLVRSFGLRVDEQTSRYQVQADGLGVVLGQRPEAAPSVAVEVGELDALGQLGSGVTNGRVVAERACRGGCVVSGRPLTGGLGACRGTVLTRTVALDGASTLGAVVTTRATVTEGGTVALGAVVTTRAGLGTVSVGRTATLGAVTVCRALTLSAVVAARATVTEGRAVTLGTVAVGRTATLRAVSVCRTPTLGSLVASSSALRTVSVGRTATLGTVTVCGALTLRAVVAARAAVTVGRAVTLGTVVTARTAVTVRGAVTLGTVTVGGTSTLSAVVAARAAVISAGGT